ncbi:MAG: diguanylate cyclase [Solibacillus sp.]
MMTQANLQTNLLSLFELNTDAILHVTLDGFILDINATFLAVSQYTKDQVIGQNYERFVIVRKKIASIESESDNQLTSEDTRFCLVKNDGGIVDCLMRKSPIKINEQLIGYFIVMKDMRELDKIAEHYLESELNYRTIAENIQDVLILMDKDLNYLYVSPSSEEMFGFAHKDIQNRTAYFNIHPDYVEEIDKKFQRALQHGEDFYVNLKAWHEERQWVWTEIKGKAVYRSTGEFKHMLLVARDISREQELQQNLVYYAYHDNLTGLPNRRLFIEKLDVAVEVLKSQQTAFTMMMIDIDYFKEINDSYGHEIGDAVIVIFGERVQQAVGNKGLVARLGGDEFVVLLDLYEEADVTEIATRINEYVREPVVIQQTVVEMTASIGVSICHQPDITVKEALRQADEALYIVKRLGRNQFSIYRQKEASSQ